MSSVSGGKQEVVSVFEPAARLDVDTIIIIIICRRAATKKGSKASQMQTDAQTAENGPRDISSLADVDIYMDEQQLADIKDMDREENGQREKGRVTTNNMETLDGVCGHCALCFPLPPPKGQDAVDAPEWSSVILVFVLVLVLAARDCQAISILPAPRSVHTRDKRLLALSHCP